MGKVHPAAWIGLVINIGMSFFALEAYGDMPALSLAMFCGAGLSALGIVLLAMGQPAGGIIGAVGSALFVPIGLVCLIGCMRTRQALISDAKNVETGLVNDVFGDGKAEAPAVPQSGHVVEGIAAFAAGAESEAVSSPAAVSAQPVAPGTERGAESVSARQSGSAVVFRFKDQRLLMVVILGLGLAAFVYMSTVMYVDITPQIVLLVVVGGLGLWVQSRILGMPALALYGDHLTCVSSQAAWAGENTVMYRLIQQASIKGNKGYITTHRMDGAGTEELKVLFNAMPSDVRAEAKQAFSAKMREIGVPFSQA